MPTPLPERVESKIDLSDPEGCWPWLAGRTQDGYGRIWFQRRNQRAHRVVYELLVGPVPDGMTLDHARCQNRACVNPAHLEPVTNAVNVLRGRGITAEQARRDACVYGHPLAGENLYRAPDGARECRICRARQARERRERDRRRRLR